MQSNRQQFVSFQDHYAQYQRKVTSFFLYRVGDRDLAEDLASDTFIKAYERFDSYDDTYAFSTWIYTIARNILIDWVRKNKETRDLSAAAEIADEENTAEQMSADVDNELRAGHIQRLLATLPELQREAILLKYIEDKSTREIATELDSSEASIRQAISRGLAKIKRSAIPLEIIILLTVLLPLTAS